MMARIGYGLVPVAGLIASLILSSGCSVLHDNVKGGFTCQAPKGVCAPSSTIDDAALAQISGNHGGDLLPASFDAMAIQGPAASKHGRRHRDNPAVAMVSVAKLPVGRPALRVVHPAWVDEQGRRHERTTDYAYVDAAPTLAYDAAAVSEAALGGAGDDHSLLGIAVRAPDAGLPPAANSSVAEALPAFPGADPNAVIRAKVNAILAKAPKPMILVPMAASPREIAPAAAAPVVAVPRVLPAAPTEVAGSARSAGVFPPAGS